MPLRIGGKYDRRKEKFRIYKWGVNWVYSYTKKNDVYNELKKKLVQKGITPNEIAFIHEADTEAKKKELFSKVRQGKVRILMGSTKKLGAETNIQDKLIATHHLDCAWKPDEVGCILRTFKMVS